MRIIMIIGMFLALFLGGCSPQKPVSEATGPWHLLPAQSHLSFISIKKNTIIETHSFGKLSGAVGVDGVVDINISLDSVETNIDIRNERMRTYLFETDTFPLATISTKIDMASFAAMPIGGRMNFSQDIVVNMHGKSAGFDVDFIVTRLGINKVAVDSRNPVVLDIEDFALQDGVEKLRELASLPSITPAISVNFSLAFER